MEEMRLNNWTRYQGMAYNDNLMSEDKINQLLLVNKNFFDINNAKWISMFESLEEYYKKNNCYPNPNSKDKEERKEKFEKILNKLGTKSADVKWDKKYNELEKFINDNQRLPKTREEGFEELGRWVNAQKTAYKKSTLTDERVNKLKDILFFNN